MKLSLKFLKSFSNSAEWLWCGDLGLLLLRAGIGISFLIHGLRIIVAGPEEWLEIGSVMENFGFRYALTSWGILGAVLQILAGFMLLIGFYTRAACLLLFFIMTTATVYNLRIDAEYLIVAHAIENIILFLAMFLMGPGKYSLDEKIESMKLNSYLVREYHQASGHK